MGQPRDTVPGASPGAPRGFSPGVSSGVSLGLSRRGDPWGVRQGIPRMSPVSPRPNPGESLEEKGGWGGVGWRILGRIMGTFGGAS